MDYKKHLFISILIFTLHNIEEAVGFRHFSFPSDISVPFFSNCSMILAVLLITIIAWGVVLWAIKQKSNTIKRNVSTTFITVFLFNALFPHIISSIYLWSYFPALITSIVLYIPYSLWIIKRLNKEFASVKQFL